MSKLKDKRLSRRLNLRMLGELVGTSAQVVQQQEQRGIRTVKTARRYAAALHCKPEELLEI